MIDERGNGDIWVRLGIIEEKLKEYNALLIGEKGIPAKITALEKRDLNIDAKLERLQDTLESKESILHEYNNSLKDLKGVVYPLKNVVESIIERLDKRSANEKVIFNLLKWGVGIGGGSFVWNLLREIL